MNPQDPFLSRPLSVHDSLVSRRRLLQTAGAGFGSLALQHLLNQEHAVAVDPAVNPLAARPPHFAPRAKSVIFLFAYGGPSHVDLIDYKPALEKWHGKSIPVFDKADAFNKTTKDTAMKSPYRFERHGKSGLYISELFPQIATCADHLCILNSLHCESNNHAPALFQMNTGFILAGRPSMGAWVTYGLGSESDSLPAFVVMWDHRGGPIGGAQNWTSGFLPAAYQGTPLRSQGEPIIDLKPPAGMSIEQQKMRLRFLEKLNRRHLEQNPG